MRSEPHTETATIYQFPVGGRAGFKGFRKEVAQVVTSQTTHVDFDSWYHQEAISEKSDLDKPHN